MAPQLHTSPCVFRDGMCVDATKDVCKNKLKGHWYKKEKTCTDARRLEAKRKAFKKKYPDCPSNLPDDRITITASKKQPEWVMGLAYGLVGLFLLLLIIGLCLYLWKSNDNGQFYRYSRPYPESSYSSSSYSTPLSSSPRYSVSYKAGPPPWIIIQSISGCQPESHWTSWSLHCQQKFLKKK